MHSSRIHISWDGPFMASEQVSIRQWLSRALMDRELRVCRCGIGLLTVERGHLPESFIAQARCGCGELAQENLGSTFLISLRDEIAKKAA